MLPTVTVLFIISTLIVIFLGKEMMKKFGFFQSFIESSNQLICLAYDGHKKPGMHNIVLRGDRPFSVLVGFNLSIPLIGQGFDYYGYVQSDAEGVAIVSTYMGKGAVEFMFYVNYDLDSNSISVSSTGEDQCLKPQAIYKPHWWQKLGFWG
jgi:hypothetical protein